MRTSLTLLALPALVAPLMAQAPAAAPSVEQLLAKHTEALGGQAKLDAMKSMRMIANIPGPGGVDVSLTIERRYPDCQRIQVEVMGQSMLTVCNAKGGWAVNPFAGQTEPKEMTAEELKSMRDSMNPGGMLLAAKAQGAAIESKGLVEVEGVKLYKLVVTPTSGKDVSTIYLDATTYLLTRAEGKRQMGEQSFNAVTTFKDFKQVAGMTFPYTQVVEAGGAPTQTIEVSTIEVNPTLADSQFVMATPAKAAPAAAGK